jgi:hypothetical protein
MDWKQDSKSVDLGTRVSVKVVASLSTNARRLDFWKAKARFVEDLACGRFGLWKI